MNLLLVEAAGFEPASENITPETPTCLVFDLNLALETAQRQVISSASLDKSYPYPLKAKGKNQPAICHRPLLTGKGGLMSPPLGSEG